MVNKFNAQIFIDDVVSIRPEQAFLSGPAMRDRMIYQIQEGIEVVLDLAKSDYDNLPEYDKALVGLRNKCADIEKRQSQYGGINISRDLQNSWADYVENICTLDTKFQALPTNAQKVDRIIYQIETAIKECLSVPDNTRPRTKEFYEKAEIALVERLDELRAQYPSHFRKQKETNQYKKRDEHKAINGF